MVPFYNFIKQEIRSVDDKRSYYGTGEAAHWAVQSNFNIAGGLAVLGTADGNIGLDKQELLDLSLKCFRYNLSTHQTGNSCASCGNKWGRNWISILGLERMISGQMALEKIMSDEDRNNFRRLRLDEADFLLTLDVLAGMSGTEGKNKPESNYWNGSFLYRTFLDYPDAPNREEYLEKSCKFLLNAISHPQDTASTQEFAGKELRHWNVGDFNFTPNYSLDHHGYMNVGYSIITLSHAAYLYFHCKFRQQEFPDFARHHVKDLWNVVKNFVFPDGRLLRIGGDTRARYCYCQMYLLPILLMMKDMGDTNALQAEMGMLELIRREQSDNSDGSFFGTRLKDMKIQSRYYYTRLESDPFAVLSLGTALRRRFGAEDVPSPNAPAPFEWQDEFHGANLVRTSSTVRSMVRRGAEGPIIMAHPLDDSSLAEWGGNGHANILARASVFSDKARFNRQFPGGFINSGSTDITEAYPFGEGEAAYVIAKTSSACAALPDGKTMIVLEYAKAVKEHSLYSLRTIGWQVPNDVYNGKKRTFFLGDRSCELEAHSGRGVIDTESNHVNIANRISLVLGYGADSLKIYAPNRSMGIIKSCRFMSSLYVNEICGNVEDDPAIRRMPGDILADTGYAVISDITASEGEKYKLTRLDAPELLRAVELTTPDGKTFRFAANFGDVPAEWENKVIEPGQCILI